MLTRSSQRGLRHGMWCAIAMVGVALLIVALGSGTAAEPAAISPTAVRESAREIPVVARADVLVVGDSSGAVAAAAEAARAGATVLLITHRPYLGGDLCATLRLWRSPD